MRLSMIKQLSLFILLATVSKLSLADTCPSISDIKNNALSGWKAFDSDDGKPLSAAREAQFKKMIEKFALAEWSSPKNKNGSIHCYYIDSTGSSLEAYFAKDNFIPKNKLHSFWYQVSGYMHCAAEKDKCEFEHHSFRTHLAKK